MQRTPTSAALVLLLAAACITAAAAWVNIKELSTGFEDSATGIGWEQVPQSGEAGAMATFDMTSNAAAHTGKHGARVTKAAEPAGELDVQLKGPGYALITGRTYRVSLWLRSSCVFDANLLWSYFPSSTSTGISTTFKADSKQYKLYKAVDFTPSVTTMYRPVLGLGQATRDCVIDVDDILVEVDAPAEFEVITGVSKGLMGFMRSAAPYTLSVTPPAAATAYAQEQTAPGGQTHGSQIKISNPGPEPYSVQVYSNQIQLHPGYTYYTTAWLKASSYGVPVGFSWNSGDPSYTPVKGSGSVFAVQKEYALFVMPAVQPDKEQSARMNLDMGGPGVPADVTVELDDIIVIKVKPSDVKPLPPADNTMFVESFEGPGQSRFKGVAKGGAQATFTLDNPGSASSGKKGARVEVKRQPDNKACDNCIQLQSFAWPAELGASYILSFDLRASVEGTSFSVSFVADMEDGSELDAHDFKATKKFTRYSTEVTTVKKHEIHVAFHLGAAAAGTVFDIDNIVIAKRGGPNVPLAAASTDFEADAVQPFVCLTDNGRAGSCKLDSTASPYSGKYSAAVKVSKSSSKEPWHVQMLSDLVSLTAGLTYTVTARIKASQKAPVTFSWNTGSPDYSELPESKHAVTVGTDWDIYTFKTDVTTSGMYQVHFDFAASAAGTILYVDDILATCDW